MAGLDSRAGDDQQRAVLEQVLAESLRFLGDLSERPVNARYDVDEVAAALGGPLPEHGAEPLAVIGELLAGAEPGVVAMPSPRFFGWVIGGVLPAALGADWLTSVWDQNAGLLASSPAAAGAERVAGDWLLELLGLPAGSAVGFVTGGMMANFTCLAAARDAVLRRVGWDVESDGLLGAPPVRVLVGQERHDTVDLALRFLGLGAGRAIEVAVDDQGRMQARRPGGGPGDGARRRTDHRLPASRQRAQWSVRPARRRPSRSPTGTAPGCTWTGRSGSGRPRRRGSSAWWPASRGPTRGPPTRTRPSTCRTTPGLAMVADAASLHAAMGVHAAYLIQDTRPDPIATVPEFSRRARGFPVWAALRSLGRSGVAGLVEGLVARAQQFAARLGELDGVEILNDVVFTQVCVSFGSDEVTREVARRLLLDGTAWMTPSTWRGRTILRISVSNHRTTEADVDLSVAAITRILDGVRADLG